MIVTIDGPAGAGKSSVAKRLAQQLGFALLDTGSMYRALTLLAMRRAIPWDNTERLVSSVDDLRLDLKQQTVWLQNDEITSEIRTAEVTREIRYVANNGAVRERLNVWQREIATDQNIVTEGRDQGSEVFPLAACKIFLTATVEERARRRVAQRKNQDENLDIELVRREIERRDEGDRNRIVGPLVPAVDAIHFCTDQLSEEDVVHSLLLMVSNRME